MMTLTILLLCVQGALLGLFLFYSGKVRDELARKERYFEAVSDISVRMEVLETRWKRLLEELEERIERGNDAWRRYRSREAGRERRAQRQEELEGESDEDAQEVLPFDAGGSDPRGMQYVSKPLEDPSDQPWRLVARQLAQTIASGGGN